MPENPILEPPCARSLAAMEVDDLLELMDTLDDGPAGEQHGSFLAVAAALAHRLGIQCESYLALMVAGTSPREWRALMAVGVAR